MAVLCPRCESPRPAGTQPPATSAFRLRLAEQFRVITFDLRGSGHSGPDGHWVSTRTMAADALELLTRLEVDRAHVFGLSLGGMAATWLASLAPARVARLCLASAPVRGLELSHAGLRRELGLAECFVRRDAEVESRLVHRILSRQFREAHPEEVFRIARLVHRTPSTRSALLRHALAGVLHDARRGLAGITAPTLVLAGADDTLLGTAGPRALAAGIGGAGFELIAQCGHDLSLEQPSATAARVARHFVG